MTLITNRLIYLEVIVGTIFLIYGYFLGPQGLKINIPMDIAIGCYVGAGFTAILGAIWGSIDRRRRSK